MASGKLECSDCRHVARTPSKHKRHILTRPTSCERHCGKMHRKSKTSLSKQAIQKYNRLAQRRSRLNRISAGSSVCVLQYEDRASLAYFAALQAVNRKWCTTCGYDYKCTTKPIRQDAPAYWQKVFMAAQCLEEYSVVVFLDSDACWHDPSTPLPRAFLRAGLHMASTTQFWKSQPEFNAGVWVCGGSQGKKIMRKWASLFDTVKKKWRLELSASHGGVWKAVGGWAGPAYEQGALNEHLRQDVHNHAFATLNSSAVNQTSQCLAKHFYWKWKSNVSAYIEANHPEFVDLCF